MESDESKWLKSRYQEAATDGPAPKRVKFDSIKEEMLAEFPHKSLSALNIHRFIEESFPNSFAKRLGHSLVRCATPTDVPQHFVDTAMCVT